MEKVHLLTLGCPKNLADSELMLGALKSAGFEITLDPEEAQVLLVNTCAFIEAAKKESIDAILEAAEVKKRGFGKRLVVAGCLSQRYATELAATMPEVDVFVGTGNFLDLPELLRRTEAPEMRPIPYAGAAHLLPTSAIPRIKTGDFFTSYLKISEGCNHKCAFCIIPKIRGLHESRPLADLVAEARNLAAAGVREINLIAQDLTAYGRDLDEPSSLAALLRELSKIEELRWIRLLYCYPNFVTAELLDAIAELPKVVKYIDMPLQHADDAMLRAMRRERSGAALVKLLDRVRGRIPGVVLRTSFIVGFPGETDAAFERLVNFVRDEQFDRVGVFTYSREENTAAYNLPDQVPERVKRARRARLMATQAEISLGRNRGLVGREMEVLVEGPMPGRATRLRGERPVKRRKSMAPYSWRATRRPASSSAHESTRRSATTCTQPSPARPLNIPGVANSMEKKPVAANRKKFLAKVREQLLETKTKLLGEIDSELRAEREGNKDEGMDTYDLASEERDREINFILSDRERVKLKQIDDALERLDEGTYGVCESCGLEIAEERLEAMPFSRLCRDCQQDQEREAKSQRRFDDERNTYRKIGSTDADDESA